MSKQTSTQRCVQSLSKVGKSKMKITQNQSLPKHLGPNVSAFSGRWKMAAQEVSKLFWQSAVVRNPPSAASEAQSGMETSGEVRDDTNTALF